MVYFDQLFNNMKKLIFLNPPQKSKKPAKSFSLPIEVDLKQASFAWLKQYQSHLQLL